MVRENTKLDAYRESDLEPSPKTVSNEQELKEEESRKIRQVV